MDYNIRHSQDLGDTVRSKRKADGLTLREAAALCNVGVRFLSELENGKPTLRLDKVLQVLTGLGLDLQLTRRGDQ